MNNLSQSIRAGLFFVFGLALLWIVYETLNETTWSATSGDTIEAHFNDLQQLKVGAEVRMAGVSIGMVSNETLAGTHAIATLSLDKGAKIPSDSIATITTAGLLGSNYVAINPGKATTYLESGATIKTRETASLSDVVAQFGRIGDEIENFMGGDEGAGDGNGLFSNLNKLVTENSERITSILSNFDQITTDLKEGHGTLGKLLADDALYDNANAFFSEARSITQNLDEGKGALGKLLNDKDIEDKIQLAVDNFADFSKKLNSDDSTLGKLISSDELYVQAADAVNKLDAAVEGVQNSGPITAVGVAASALF